jgi:hypothetical protein
VPAERQADAARDAAKKAEQSEAKVKQQMLDSAPKLRAAARDGARRAVVARPAEQRTPSMRRSIACWRPSADAAAWDRRL